MPVWALKVHSQYLLAPGLWVMEICRQTLSWPHARKLNFDIRSGATFTTRIGPSGILAPGSKILARVSRFFFECEIDGREIMPGSYSFPPVHPSYFFARAEQTGEFSRARFAGLVGVGGVRRLFFLFFFFFFPPPDSSPNPRISPAP